MGDRDERPTPEERPTSGAIPPIPTGPTPTPTNPGCNLIIHRLTLGTTLMFFSMLLILAFCPIPDKNKDLFNVLLGVLGTAWGGSIIGFFFGSSSASQAKDETINRMTGGGR